MTRALTTLLLMVLCAVAAGCADDGRHPDDNRFGGVYGGVSGAAVP
ncbi:MAG: hypothetical protein JO032_10145 [Alphaproteobacteria bacterium]|nr:hypothetical protein [Alphaproteobacteria bacterium]